MASALTQVEPGSFRDRQARIFYRDSQVYRALSEEASRAWKALSQTRFFARGVEEGRIVATQEADLEPGCLPGSWASVLRHETLPFISYPYEWTFHMLQDAALLHLDLLLEALEEDFTCKDASPYNLQFVGSRPVFMDVASFEPCRPGQVWTGYRQFCTLFLYPLMLCAYKGVDFHPWLRSSLEGIEPADMARLLGRWDVFKPGVLSHVWLQAAASDRFSDHPTDVAGSLAQAGFDKKVVKNLLEGMQRVVKRLRWQPPKGPWLDYTATNLYSDADEAAKAALVERVCQARKPGWVWDLGANTGHYSRLAAGHARRVLALEGDHAAADHLYKSLRDQGDRTILPLRMDLANPSCGWGWRGRERKPLEERGRPDLVLCLAVTHHLCLSAHIPLADWLDWLVSLGGEVIVEFVDREDPQVVRLLRNKSETYQDYGREQFLGHLQQRSEVLESLTLPCGTRSLYHVRPR